jgi:hypothetical protein
LQRRQNLFKNTSLNPRLKTSRLCPNKGRKNVSLKSTSSRTQLPSQVRKFRSQLKSDNGPPTMKLMKMMSRQAFLILLRTRQWQKMNSLGIGAVEVVIEVGIGVAIEETEGVIEETEEVALARCRTICGDGIMKLSAPSIVMTSNKDPAIIIIEAAEAAIGTITTTILKVEKEATKITEATAVDKGTQSHITKKIIIISDSSKKMDKDKKVDINLVVGISKEMAISKKVDTGNTTSILEVGTRMAFKDLVVAINKEKVMVIKERDTDNNITSIPEVVVISKKVGINLVVATNKEMVAISKKVDTDNITSILAAEVAVINKQMMASKRCVVVEVATVANNNSNSSVVDTSRTTSSRDQRTNQSKDKELRLVTSTRRMTDRSAPNSRPHKKPHYLLHLHLKRPR